MTILLGRDPELRALGTLVDGLVDPAGTVGTVATAAVVIVGEFGLGKTALLTAAAEHAARVGVRVLRADGCREEADLPFAALGQLLASLTHLVDDLPEHLGRTVEALTHGTAAGDVRTVSLHVLQVLVHAARHAPLAVLVDDADRLDQDSLRTLLFVARRARLRDGLGIVVAGRGDVRPLPGDTALPTLALAPLDATAAAALLESLPVRPPARVRQEILDAAAGNPLAVREMAAAGTARPLEAAGRGATEFADVLGGLPPDTRRLLLHAAAAEGAPVAVIETAAGAAGPEAWAPAERAGLVVLDGPRVAFRSPLARTACYALATAADRRHAHLGLAGADREPDRSAWQRAHGTVGDDDAVGAALAAVAERAEVRGAPRAAARAWERAAECSAESAVRLARLGRALVSTYAAGDTAWMADLREAMEHAVPDATVRVRTAVLGAAAQALAGRQCAAVRVLEGVAPLVGVTDPASAVLLATFLRVVADFSGLPEHDAAATALMAHPALPSAVGPVAGSTGTSADIMWSLTTLRPDRVATAAALEEALRAGRGGPEANPNDLQNLGTLADQADDIHRAVDLLARAQTGSRHEGPSAFGAGLLAVLLVEHGRWTEASRTVALWSALADAGGLAWVAVEIASVEASLLAWRGEPAAAHEVLARARQRVDLGDNLVLDVRLRAAASIAAMVEGDRAQAYRQLRGAFTHHGEARHALLSTRLIARLAAAATGPTERADAAAVVARVRAATADRTTTWLRMLLHHADALLGSDHGAEHHFRLALTDPAGEDWPLERAQARLHYGEWLRRRRRPLEARDMLVASLETFETLGASAAADRVRAELRAAGAADHPGPETDADALAPLSPQQREIVRLAAAGLRNREIAERLHLSPRTVGSHLHHAYPKLGVSGRHQLATLLHG
ncbi:helix-turn-helix transcriptional regulator [Actinomycetospora aeridis]|uniref:LuxR C-terminal-related transcriptional regulator n=1 Tax=Actinomycetospora aeridis TaxID=3129231 RepID=A0ABU8NCR0_9PSEU